MVRPSAHHPDSAQPVWRRGTDNSGGFYKFGQFYFYLSLRQPIELGHQTTHRYNIAKAALDQQHWTVVQAELLALVQAYRFFETAAYRRERLRVASELADFNDRLLKTLERRLEANQIPPADVVLARVESQATHQLVKAAQQDYVTALTDLRNQIGIPESAAAAEPLGEFTLPPFIPPVKEQEFVDLALQNRPDILAAQAGVTGTKAAENLARADRIPSPIIGPQYAMDEAGIQYIGLVYITPIPIWNNGKPLVHQRQADHYRAHLALQQAQQRTVAQVRSALSKWNGASELVKETVGLTTELTQEVAKLERLFDQGQTDLAKLIQARQRLIQLKTAEIDATWAATQAQADLLLALGAPALIQGMLNQAESAATTPASVSSRHSRLEFHSPRPLQQLLPSGPHPNRIERRRCRGPRSDRSLRMAHIIARALRSARYLVGKARRAPKVTSTAELQANQCPRQNSFCRCGTSQSRPSIRELSLTRGTIHYSFSILCVFASFPFGSLRQEERNFFSRFLGLVSTLKR